MGTTGVDWRGGEKWGREHKKRISQKINIKNVTQKMLFHFCFSQLDWKISLFLNETGNITNNKHKRQQRKNKIPAN